MTFLNDQIEKRLTQLVLNDQNKSAIVSMIVNINIDTTCWDISINYFILFYDH